MAHSALQSVIAVLAIVLPVTMPARAQNVTDGELLQAVAAVEAELAAFNRANHSLPEQEVAVTSLAPRVARHVVYKARDLLGRVQLLRRLNGMEEQPVANAPVKGMDGADAREAVDRIAAALRDLRPGFGNPPIPTVSPAGSVTPMTDAYAGLLRAERALRALDMPAVIPNEVYRIALQAASDIERIAAARGGGIVAAEPLPAGLTPRDAYEAAYQLLEELKRLTEEKTEYAVPGGIILPPPPGQSVRPEEVVDLLVSIVAELSAVKTSIGLTQPTKRISPQAGKTPSDTVAVLRAARLTVASLRDAKS